MQQLPKARLGGLVLVALGLALALPEPSAATGEPCSLFSPCASANDYCRVVSFTQSICTERGDGRESCTGLGQGTCKPGLACDFLGECRHQPGRVGELCGTGVPCAAGLNCSSPVAGRCEAPDGPGESCTGIGQGTCQSGLVCDFLGECRHDPPQLGQPCGVGVPCAGDLVCSSGIGGRCIQRAQGGEPCTGLGQGTCADGLACDFVGVCRHQPSLLGEPCGAGVPCSPELGCSADIGGVCEPRGGAGQRCSGTGQGSCEAGLVCDFLRECRHPTPELNEPCGIGVECAAGLFCQGGTQRCKAYKTVGEGCSAFNQCQPGLSCEACSVAGCLYPLQCFPNANDGAITEQQCRALYSPELHQAARDLGGATTWGSGNGASALVSESQEFGVAYGQDEYGCYTTFCVGADIDLELTAGFLSVGIYDDYDSVGGASTAFTQEAEILGVLNFSTSQIFERRSADPFDLGALIGTQSCFSFGLSPDLIPVSAGVHSCTTVLDTVLGAPPVCGDGVREGSEACDDGNRVGGDGCSAGCTVEALCGNGRRDAGEQCDDGNRANGDGCDDMCKIEPRCGDGNLDPGEQCDDGNTSPSDGCSALCSIEAVCGNDLVEPGERCDDGNALDGDGCSAACQEEDADADGVPDLADNCVLVPNPDQADANAGEDDDASQPGIQHYGDACDLDFDGDGIVGISDFFALLRPCLGERAVDQPSCEPADVNGDGVVSAADFFTGFRPALGLAAGPGVTEP